MLPEIKLTITQNDKLVETVTKTIEKQCFVKSLEEFQVEANATLTKMIEEVGDTSKAGGDGMDDDNDDDEDNDEDNDEEEDDADCSPSVSEHSKSKKKKHS